MVPAAAARKLLRKKGLDKEACALNVILAGGIWVGDRACPKKMCSRCGKNVVETLLHRFNVV